MSLPALIFLVVLLLFLAVAGLPNTHWGYGRNIGGGYSLSAILLIVLVVLIVFAVTGRL